MGGQGGRIVERCEIFSERIVGASLVYVGLGVRGRHCKVSQGNGYAKVFFVTIEQEKSNSDYLSQIAKADKREKEEEK